MVYFGQVGIVVVFVLAAAGKINPKISTIIIILHSSRPHAFAQAAQPLFP